MTILYLIALTAVGLLGIALAFINGIIVGARRRKPADITITPAMLRAALDCYDTRYDWGNTARLSHQNAMLEALQAAMAARTPA